MSPTIIADVEKRGVKNAWDRLAIVGNCCSYPVRMDIERLRRSGYSLSLSMLAMCLLNGEILDNRPSDKHTPLNITVSEFLKAQSFDRLSSPLEQRGLTFNKGSRFINVKLNKSGILTKGHLWRLGRIIQTAHFNHKHPRVYSPRGELTSPEQRYLAQLAQNLKTYRESRDLAGRIAEYLREDAFGCAPFQTGENYMCMMMVEVSNAIKEGKTLRLGSLVGSDECMAIFICESDDQPGFVFTSSRPKNHNSETHEANDTDRHVSLAPIGLLDEKVQYPMATASSLAAARPVVGQALQDAVKEFRSVLNEEQRCELDKLDPVPDANAILVFTARLDRIDPNRRGRSFSSRLHTILLAVRNFCSIVDTFVSSHPEIAALVWGSAFWNSFEQEFKSDIDDIQRLSNHVKEDIALAQAQADSQERQLQALEREHASFNRSAARKFFSRTDERLDQMHEWQVQRDARKTRKRRQQLLDALSTYDHLRALKQSRLKRYKNTSDWIFQTPEFRRWADGEVPLLCCFGKSKTIATASVIDHILCERGSDCTVSFFFMESGNPESLCADTIIRSILRQRLDPTNIPREVVEGLELLGDSGLDELVKLLHIIMPPPKASYIVIDGFDECEKPDRDTLLIALSSLAVSKNIRLFLSGRAGIWREIQLRFTTFNIVSMDCPLAHDGIQMFIEDIVREKIQNRELRIGDPCLEGEIKLALSHGAQGMLLWVIFQIYEICAQHCDEDIRNILKHLPKSLTETYCRVLQRIISRGHGKDAQKIFPWIAASKQFLSLSQLREAIAIEIGQQYLKPERLYNDIENAALWCENLIQVDEEDQLVQFAHSTVREFLVKEPLDSTLVEFHVDVEEFDHYIGEICVTYLNLNDFKTTVARRAKPLLLHDTTQIIQSALGHQSKSASMLAKLRPKSASKPVDLSALQSLTGKNSFTNHEKLVLGYPFLDYASTNWILHTKNFQRGISKTWRLWENMIVYGHDLVKPPWGVAPLNADYSILEWAYDICHLGLIGLVASPNTLVGGRRARIIQRSVTDRNIDVLSIFFKGENLGWIKDYLLRDAAGKGHLEIVEGFLATNANANVVLEDCPDIIGAHDSLDSSEYLTAVVTNKYHGLTALHAAVEGGHLEVAKRLIAAKVDINTATKDGESALCIAARCGHIEIVNILLATGADVNAAAADLYGKTALQAAAKGGNIEIVKMLLAAKADINAAAVNESGQTALQAAAKGGNIEIVKILLAAKADINAANKHGYTALQAAAENGHIEIVDILLISGADVNAADSYGQTALQAAAEYGHIKIVGMLLAAKADVNVVTYNGYTALQKAARNGRTEIVKTLLAAKADANAAPSYGRTALQAAAEHGHLRIVEMLLAAKADINAATKHGYTALQAAAGNGHVRIVDILLTAKADVNAVNSYGRTALHAATESYHIKIVKMLLAAKADIQLAFNQEFRGLPSWHGIVLGTLQTSWRIDEKCVLCQILSKTTHETSIDALLSEARRGVVSGELDLQFPFQLRAFPLLPHLGGIQHQDRAAGLRNEVSEYFLAAVPDPSGAFSDGVYQKALRDQVAERGYLVCHQSSTRPLFIPRVVSCVFEPSIVKDWLNCCQVHHMSCLLDQNPSRLHDVAPKLNLIDCESRRVVNCSTLDRHVELEYVALSYIWGSGSDASITTEVGPQLLSMLPRVIEDAISVTLSLGYRFIWVDRYCIDQHDVSKKHEQIMHMDLIYQYAALTIIAAAGTDETYGLPGVSRMRPTRQWSFKGDDYSITSTLPSPQCFIRQSRWATRGWTYQEAVLSTRRLVFTDDQLYFECNSMSCYESLDISWDAYYSRSRPYLKEFMRPTLFSFQQTVPASDSRHPSPELVNFTTYTRCAGQYSRRTLSFDNDSLNAFGGIIRKLETTETSPVYHIWGVPFIYSADQKEQEDHSPLVPSTFTRLFPRQPLLLNLDQVRLESLAAGLSWRHDISTVPPRRRTGFPSWSWVGWEGAVTWPTMSQNTPFQSLKWPSTSIYFKERDEDTQEACDAPAQLNQLQHPRILCIETTPMSRDAFTRGEDPRKLCISSGGRADLYPSKRGLDAEEALQGIQNGYYEVIELATIGANSYLMLVNLKGRVAYRVGTLVARLFENPSSRSLNMAELYIPLLLALLVDLPAGAPISPSSENYTDPVITETETTQETAPDWSGMSTPVIIGIVLGVLWAVMFILWFVHRLLFHGCGYYFSCCGSVEEVDSARVQG
ncbi:hypothetical protein GQX73_g8449 [Xylaria multiplex]|uniref:Uncharacterized protein n=1 Tax=Xylaria multiplex TaxID=323545 RepID=A0A7C8MNY6_9PEZI|nr:hypothetical protein GQX73_g8449 [Xylaria multiplex]